MINPDTVAALQRAARTNSQQAYQQFADLCNNDARNRCTLRGLLDFNDATPIDLEQVEPAANSVKRFRTGAMS